MTRLLARFATVLATLVGLALPALGQDTPANRAQVVPPGKEQIVAGLSQNQVSITATFVGSEILIYGAVKRESPPPEGPLGVAIVVEGPSHPITVRRKAHRMGIWINTDSVRIQAAPTFYAVATSGPFHEVVSDFVDHRNHISIPEAIRVLQTGATPDLANFAEAVIRIRGENGLYKFDEGAVTVREGTLFDTRIALPSNLTEGEYRARIYLTRDGKVVAKHLSLIDVRKVGLERWLYNLAHQQALAYGLMSLAVAVIAGWGASAFFRAVFRN
jgi:uncharacterized protein (TIGR02186 family)